jgi:hypothetical protein
MEEIDVVLALSAKLSLHLVFDPEGAVTQPMNMAPFVEPSRHR